MSLLFRHWLDEGYYEEDAMGDLTKIEDPVEIRSVKKDGNLYHHDGYSLSKITDESEISDEYDKSGSKRK